MGGGNKSSVESSNGSECGGVANNRVWWLGCKGSRCGSGSGGDCALLVHDGNDGGGDGHNGVMFVVAVASGGDDNGDDGNESSNDGGRWGWRW